MKADFEFSGFRLVRHLGRGSSGDVFEAVRVDSSRAVLKLASDELCDDAEFVRRFLEAGHKAMTLGSTRVAQVLDVGQREGRPFLAVEYVPNVSLSTLLERRTGEGAPLSVALAVGVAGEIAQTLEHAHRHKGLVHGDLSPSNVLLTPEGQVKLSDFCLADALFSAFADMPSLVGKWAHASPERARGEPPTPASDLFSLGILLFELLTGESPVARPNVERTRRALALLDTPPALPGGRAPPQLADVVRSLLEPDPARRPASAARVHEALLAAGYEAGARFDPSELGAIVRRTLAEAAPTPASLQGLLESYSEPPPPAIELRWEPLETRDSVPPSWSERGSRREVTVLVIAADDDLPDDAVARMDAALSRHGARVLELAPRQVTAVFGLAQDDGRDVENAARAGHVVLRFFQHGRVGVSGGLASLRTRVSPEGDPAEPQALRGAIEAALSRTGRRGWLVIDEHCARQLRRFFELEPLGGEGRAWVVEEPLSEPLGQFVGRKPELRRMGELLQQASGGQLQVVGLLGRAGVGKSRFLVELGRRLRAGSSNVDLLVATCPPSGRSSSLSAMDSMLRAVCDVREGDSVDRIHHVLPRLRALGLGDYEVAATLVQLGAGAERRELPSGAPLDVVMARVLARLARERLQVFCWDNAQEIDATSAQLLQSMLPDLAARRIVLVFAARPDEHAPFRDLPGYVEVGLEDLDVKDVRRLLERRLAVDRIPDKLLSFFHERAGGHPMFLEELVHEALASGALVVRHRYIERAELDELAVPRTLHSLLSDRIRRLPDAERNLLVAAAVVGEPVDTAVLAEMTELDIPAVRELSEALERRELVRLTGPGAMRFSSRLLPEVVLSGLDAELLVVLHQRAADALQATSGGADEDAARIAEHLVRAGRAGAAARHYAGSGLFNLRSRRFDRAASELAHALESAELAEVGAGELSIWVSALAEAASRVNQDAGVMAAVQRLERLLDPSALTPSLRFDMARALAEVDRDDEARRRLTRLLEDPETSLGLRRGALTALAELALRRGEFAEALERIAAATELGAGSAREQHRMLLTSAQALASTDRFDEAFAALKSAAEVATPSDAALACQRARTRAVVCGFCGDWQGCADASEEAAEQGREAGLIREVAANLHNLGEASIRLGDLARGYAALQSSLSLAEGASLQRIANFDRLLLAYLDALDDLPRADEIFEERLSEATRRGWTLDRLTGRYLLGKLMARRGDRERARRELEAVRDQALCAENRPLSRDCEHELAALVD